MVYLFGVLGFIGGFFVGQYLLLKLLRGRSTQELLSSKKIKWTYGLLNWVIAVIGSYIFVFIYNYYF